VVDDLDEVLALKASAKSARSDADWDGAVADLLEAIDILKEMEATAGPSLLPRLAAEFADTYGMMGGIHRRWGLNRDGAERHRHLQESVAAYDEGFGYERGLEASEASTYNRINRLISRVLLDPAILEGHGSEALDAAEELREAEEILVEQLGSARQRDPWSYCDLGTVQLLRGAPEALSTVHELDRLRPPAFVYESALATLEPLADVAGALRPELWRAVELLRRLARHAS
jgi:hypothetical protein